MIPFSSDKRANCPNEIEKKSSQNHWSHYFFAKKDMGSWELGEVSFVMCPDENVLANAHLKSIAMV